MRGRGRVSREALIDFFFSRGFFQITRLCPGGGRASICQSIHQSISQSRLSFFFGLFFLMVSMTMSSAFNLLSLN